MLMTNKSLGLQNKKPSNATMLISYEGRKLAPTGRYVATVNGVLVWDHNNYDTGYSGYAGAADEWMSDMLLASDPFAMTETERFSWSNAARYGGEATPAPSGPAAGTSREPGGNADNGHYRDCYCAGCS